MQSGWYPDPVRRFAERHWNGERWTDRVRTRGGEETRDPAPTAAEIAEAVRRRAGPVPGAAGAFPLPPGAERSRRPTPVTVAVVAILALAATLWVILR